MKTFIKKLFNEYLPVLLALLVFILILLNLNTCNRLNNEKYEHNKDILKYENNIIAQHDSITTYYDNVIEQKVSEKTSYLIEKVEDLKKYNEDLYNEFKNVKNIVAGIDNDVSVLIENIDDDNEPVQIDTNTYKIPFNFNYEDSGLVQKIIGKSIFHVENDIVSNSTSYLDSSYLKIKLKYAFKEEENKYKVWATSPSDKVNFDDMNGFIYLDKVIKEEKNRKWSFGPTASFGITTDVSGNNMRLGWMLGVGANYNIFGKKKLRK